MKEKQTVLLRSNWALKAADGTEWRRASVPGDVYSDLLAAGKMEDPYFRDNELKALKLMEQNYRYETVFAVPDEMLKREYIVLRFEGIDTLADIYLDGHWLAYVNNMHRIWEFNVKEYLKEADSMPGALNEAIDGSESPSGRKHMLSVQFHSPTKYIREKYAEKPLEGTSDAMRGFPYLRKAHCMFGWDWGPRLPGAGIWRDVSLIAFDKARIDSVYVTQRHEEGKVELDVRADMICGDGRTFSLGKEEADGGGSLLFEARPELAALGIRTEVLDPEGNPVAEGDGGTPVIIEHPRLWWPSGYGKQPLYTVKVSLVEEGAVLDTWERRIGLRTMTVTVRPDQYGESFAHTVNGVELFAMGADYIPEDCLLARTGKARTRRLLEDAKEAHFNCIRVWGGGYYPDDWFYDTCDELGLIVWQDFMFACAVYDLTEEFEENIRAEFADNIKRLRHHASLGLWCGNNEMEMFVKEGQWVTSPKERSDYVKMYEYILPEMLKKYDPQTFYWPASPSSGGCFDDPNDENRGDVHYWEVWHGNKPITEYRKFHFRYLSEFGFQSFPAEKTIESFTLPEDRNIYSYVMEKHQRNAAANGKISEYMSQTYLYPSTFGLVIYASQLLQAQAIRYGVEHFRRWRGRCMGTVFWQLNDCWPVASWSSIDYYGRWKALHYYARRFFAPVLLSCEEEGILTQDTNPNAEPYEVKKSIRFNVCNETMESHKVTVVWSLRNAGGEILREESEDVEAPALKAVWLEKKELPEADLYGDHVYYGLLEDGRRISQGSVLFCQPKYYRFRNPDLTSWTEGTEIVVSSAAYARDVEIQSENQDLVLSDNYFDMEPGQRRIRILRGNPEGIRLRSTWDIR